jgi:hypothetical protein
MNDSKSADLHSRIMDVCKLCYREYARAQGWDNEQMAREGRISEFVHWLRQEKLLTRDRQAILQAGIPAEAVDLVQTNIVDADDFTACATLIPRWVAITTSGRPPLQSPIVSSSMVLALDFADGTSLVQTVPTVYEQGHSYPEGFILAVMEEQFRETMHVLRENGLKAVKQKYGVPTDPQRKEAMAHLWSEMRSRKPDNGDSE